MTTTNKVYLKDYTAPTFEVLEVFLDICVFDDHAIVTSKMQMQRATEGALVLFGRELELVELKIDDELISAQRYTLDDECLVVSDVPDKFVVYTKVKISPQTNTTLEGLYQAGSGKDTMFVTQCEPEGFRKITFFPDRPDVLTTYTTRVEADKKYPVLLANGNLVETGELDDDRHFAIWHDPTRKPSYLFACVVADLQVMTDSFVTSEGKEVLLEIYASEHDIDKCQVAMQALKDAMAWDEKHYGRAYDLDRYMIVATAQFNMGAMENKGLNIFNTSCVLSSPQTTTDERNFFVKSVIAHEYFHNWTGNRITCRDWFQLCLKEGLTVFRDQSFSESLQSASVQRIDDVATLKAHQFPEDAGALSHPPRPAHFVEINNFYTTTVYEKGAEISRMMATLLGKEKFRQGTDCYFEMFDGQAVTVEDWIFALSKGSGVDLSAFLRWYNQPRTPTLRIKQSYDETTATLTLNLEQSVKPHDDYPDLHPVPIPVALALFDRETGEALTLSCQKLLESGVKEGMYLLTDSQDRLVFEGVATRPVVSLLRNFSAPVVLEFDYDDTDLVFLIEHETNGFNKWQAMQAIIHRVLVGQSDNIAGVVATLLNTVPSLIQTDPMLAARLFDIPGEQELASLFVKDYTPSVVKQIRDSLKLQIATGVREMLPQWYQALPIVEYEDTALAKGRRMLRNVLLDMSLLAKLKTAEQWAYEQYEHAQCMSERLGALSAMVAYELPKAEQYLAQFYQAFSDEALVIDSWFSVQAKADSRDVAFIAQLMDKEEYDWHTPNRVRTTLGGLVAKPVQLWTQAGLQLYLSAIEKLDGLNPVLASRMLAPLAHWHTLNDKDKAVAYAQLSALKQKVHSKNVLEFLDNMLIANKGE